MVQNSNKFYTMAFRFSQSVVLDNILIKSHPCVLFCFGNICGRSIIAPTVNILMRAPALFLSFFLPYIKLYLRDDDSREYERASDVRLSVHNLSKYQRTADRGEHGLCREYDRRGGRIAPLLTEYLERVSYTG